VEEIQQETIEDLNPTTIRSRRRFLEL